MRIFGEPLSHSVDPSLLLAAAKLLDLLLLVVPNYFSQYDLMFVSDNFMDPMTDHYIPFLDQVMPSAHHSNYKPQQGSKTNLASRYPLLHTPKITDPDVLRTLLMGFSHRAYENAVTPLPHPDEKFLADIFAIDFTTSTSEKDVDEGFELIMSANSNVDSIIKDTEKDQLGEHDIK